mmetsp:Transcript_84309/g.260715  ORF Transcript_84309/g.260715 Transcript_84309/m.260715 type:complete len:207 (+) Transcript_84309:822-1442(+)
MSPGPRPRGADSPPVDLSHARQPCAQRDRGRAWRAGHRGPAPGPTKPACPSPPAAPTRVHHGRHPQMELWSCSPRPIQNGHLQVELWCCHLQATRREEAPPAAREPPAGPQPHARPGSPPDRWRRPAPPAGTDRAGAGRVRRAALARASGREGPLKARRRPRRPPRSAPAAAAPAPRGAGARPKRLHPRRPCRQLPCRACMPRAPS